MKFWKYFTNDHLLLKKENIGHYFEITDTAAKEALDTDGAPQIFYGKLLKVRRNYVIFQPSTWMDIKAMPDDTFPTHPNHRKVAPYIFSESPKNLRKKLRLGKKTRIASDDIKDILSLKEIDFPEEYNITEKTLP
jgi:hypothetical protein